MVPVYKSVIVANIKFRLGMQGSKEKRTGSQVTESKQRKQKLVSNGEREGG